MVRIGKERNIHPEVRHYALEDQVDKRRKDVEKENSNIYSLKENEKLINETKKKLGDELAKNIPDAKRDLLFRKLREEELKLKKIKVDIEAFENSKGKNENTHRIREELLMNADIVAATLNSSMNGQMENFFVKRKRSQSKS